MEVLRWDKRFSVGNQEIDQQHKMLFNFANYLTTGSGKGYKQHEMEEILEELVAYTTYHFSYEEKLLEKHPSIDSHREIHADFVEKVQFFEEAFKYGKEEINGELFTFLVTWIKNHIMLTDIAYFQEITIPVE